MDKVNFFLVFDGVTKVKNRQVFIVFCVSAGKISPLFVLGMESEELLSQSGEKKKREGNCSNGNPCSGDQREFPLLSPVL